MKQQTLEAAAREAAEDCYEMPYNENLINMRIIKEAFEFGAEWQAKQSPWISVKDKLPDNQNIVLVRDEYGGFCTAYLHGPKSGFITYGEEAYRKFGEITHWMPIPPLKSNDNE